MRSVRPLDRPRLVAATLLAVLLAAPAARAQDEDDAEPFVGESIIPWDLPEDSDGVVEPNEMDVRALAELFDSLCAPPPPVQSVHVGTFDAATGDFIWGEDILMIPTHEFLMDLPVDVSELFEGVGIEDLHFDLDPAITGLGSAGLVNAGLSQSMVGAVGSGASSAGAPKPKPASAAAKGKVKPAGEPAGEPASDRVRGHPDENGVMRTICQAAKLVLVVDVVNRTKGPPLVLTVDGVTVQSTTDSVDILVPPRTLHEFAVSCGKAPEFADTLNIGRPPLMGAFTLEALPVALVYEPPGGSGCSQTWTQTHRVGTQIRSFQSDDSAATQPVDTPFSRVGDYIALLGGAGSAAASSNVPYVAQAGAAASAAATAMEAAWGHSTTTETIGHTVTETNVLSFQLSETASVSTGEGLGPGEGDLYYLLINPTFAWMVVEHPPSHRLYVTVTLLGYQGHATASARLLRSHTMAMPSAQAQDQLLALDPLAAEYIAPAKTIKAAKSGGLGLGGSAQAAPPRLLPLASPLIIVGGGSNSFSVGRMIEASDLVETQDIRTTTTEEEGGLLSFVSKDVPQTGTRTLRVLGGRSTLNSVSDEVSVSVTLAASSDAPLYLEAFYDRLFGTFAFKPFEPGAQAMSGSVVDAEGLPKPAHELKVKLPDGRTMSTRTDGSGHFEVRPPAGVEGPLMVESAGGRTRVDWNGTAKGDVIVRESKAQPKAKAGDKKTKTSGTKFPDPSTVPVTPSPEGTTTIAQRGKPGPEKGKAAPEGPVIIKADPTMKGRLGRLVVSFAGEAAVSGCSMQVFGGQPEKSVLSTYGTVAQELMPATYAVSISGVRVPGVEVKSGHETRVQVGVLRVEVAKGTRLDFYVPGSDTAFHACYGGVDLLLPPGRVEVAVAGMREAVEVRAGEITPF